MLSKIIWKLAYPGCRVSGKMVNKTNGRIAENSLIYHSKRTKLLIETHNLASITSETMICGEFLCNFSQNSEQWIIESGSARAPNELRNFRHNSTGTSTETKVSCFFTPFHELTSSDSSTAKTKLNRPAAHVGDAILEAPFLVSKWQSLLTK